MGIINTVQRTLIFIVVFAILPALAIIFSSSMAEREKNISRLNDVANKEIDMLLSSTQINQKASYNLIRVLANQQKIRFGTEKECAAELALFASNENFFSNILVITKEKKIIASLNPIPSINEYIEDHWLQEAILSQKFSIESPHGSKEDSNKLITHYIYPVFGLAKGNSTDPLECERYIIAETAMQVDQLFSENNFLLAGSLLTIRDATGVPLYTYPKSLHRSYYQVNPWVEIQKNRAFNGVLHIAAENGEKYSVSYKRTMNDVEKLGKELTFEVVSSAAQDIRFANDVLTHNLLLLFLISITIALFIGQILLIKPVKLLLFSAQEWTKGNLSARTNVKNYHGEMKELASAFNNMVAAIEHRSTELLNAKNAAEVANKTKSNFIANMSHELRTPMNAILGMAFLAMKTETDQKQKGYILKIYNSAKSLFSIINDILDFSKIETEHLAMEMTEFKLEDVLDNISSFTCRQADEKGIDVLFIINPSVPDILIGDPLRIGQVLTNLLSNAVKFTEKGEIVLSCTLDARIEDRIRLLFTVKDTGIGISSEQQKNLFTAFNQVESSLTRRFGGTGLGLAISKNLIEMMEGTIEVESELGKGSTFTFTATFNLPSQESVRQRYLHEDALPVLVVDDNDAARRMIRTILGSIHFEANTASSADEAFSMLLESDQTYPYRVVLMDWRMPGMNGIDATKHLLNKLHLKNPPIVFIVTAMGHPEVMLLAENAGAAGVFYKPINKSTLFESISDALRRKEGQIEIRKSPSHVKENTTIYSNFEGKKVLLVEDNVINQQLAQDILESAGISVTVASNGNEALQFIKNSEQNPPFALVLMDLEMPEKNGYETTKEIRKTWQKEELPIIAMTAHNMADDRDSCIEHGMNDHVTKPIHINSFFATLQKWIALDEPQKEIEENVNATGDKEASLVTNEFELLYGINPSLALYRLGENKGLYRKLLQQFLDFYVDSHDKFSIALMHKKSNEAQRIAHTLKGLLGSIGAEELANEFAIIEEALGKGEQERAEKLSPPSFSKLSQVLASIEEFFAKEKKVEKKLAIGREQNTPLSQEEKAGLISVLKELKVLLEDSDASAAVFFSHKSEYFHDFLPKSLYSSLEMNLNLYEFEKALELITEHLTVLE